MTARGPDQKSARAPTKGASDLPNFAHAPKAETPTSPYLEPLIPGHMLYTQKSRDPCPLCTERPQPQRG